MSAHFELAQEALRSARLLLDAGDCHGAANRAYYAFFYAARGAIGYLTGMKVGDIKTHRGLRRMFQLHVVKPGLIDQRIAVRFNDVEVTRIIADYGDDRLQAAEAEAAVRDAEAFVAACENLVRESNR